MQHSFKKTFAQWATISFALLLMTCTPSAEENLTVSVTDVTLSPSTVTLEIGDTKELIVRVLPTNATNTNVTWDSDTPTVATVDNGLVRAISSGTAIITVTTEDGSQEATSTITVNKEEPQPTEWQIPTVRIYTRDGAPINSRTVWTNMASFELIDPNNPENNVFCDNARNEIRGRGNTTWAYPKRPYRFRFREPTSLFGLTAHRNWILLAEFQDPTFLMNATTFHLGREVFDHQPFTNTYHWVELYLNGEFQGLYGLTEHRQADPLGVGEPGRVRMDFNNGGWFIQMDIIGDPPKFRTNHFNLPIIIQSNDAATGDPDDSNNPAYDFIRNDWDKLTTLMASSTFPENGYRDLIDMDTFVDFLMINEIVGNSELKHPKSVFAYRENSNERISMGMLWDFDWAFSYAGGGHRYFITGSYTGDFNQRSPRHPFFQRFFDDPVFVALYRERWNEKHSKLTAVPAWITEMSEKLEPAWTRDAARWRIPGGYWHDYPTNYRAEINRMITWWNNRVNWLNMELNR